MRKLFSWILLALTPTIVGLKLPACADESAVLQIREEIWALPITTPILAYLVRPVDHGPFPLVIMNHGVSLDPRERSFFPLIEFRDAAFWLARRGYMVVAPVRPGYGVAALDVPERGIHSLFLSNIGNCANPSFRDAGLAIATLDTWIIEFMAGEKLIVPNDVVVVGQSGGGWGAIALSSQNPSAVRAMIVFAGGRGGHLEGKPNNNCAPDKLVEATGEFGRTSRIPMLWIYTQNDTFFGPTLSKRMYEAFTAAGGNAEYHLFPAFGSDGHFMMDSKDATQIWAPLVSEFLDKHRR